MPNLFIPRLCAAALVSACSVASASVYKLSFSATDFKPHAGDAGTVSPPHSLTGWFLFEGDIASRSVTSLLDLDVEVEGHRYSVPEVTFRQIPEDEALIFGGVLTGAAALANWTNDFAVTYSWASPAWGSVLYTTSLSRGFSYTENVSFTVSAIPEPQMYALAAAGLLTLLTARTARRGSPLPVQR